MFYLFIYLLFAFISIPLYVHCSFMYLFHNHSLSSDHFVYLKITFSHAVTSLFTERDFSLILSFVVIIQIDIDYFCLFFFFVVVAYVTFITIVATAVWSGGGGGGDFVFCAFFVLRIDLSKGFFCLGFFLFCFVNIVCIHLDLTFTVHYL